MKRYVQPGKVLTIKTKQDTHLSGDLVHAGDIFGIASHDSLEDGTVSIATEGVYQLPKAPYKSICLGATAYYHFDTKVISPEFKKNKSRPIGYFVHDETEESKQCLVRLIPSCNITSKQVGTPLSDSEEKKPASAR